MTRDAGAYEKLSEVLFPHLSKIVQGIDKTMKHYTSHEAAKIHGIPISVRGNVEMIELQ